MHRYTAERQEKDGRISFLRDEITRRKILEIVRKPSFVSEIGEEDSGYISNAIQVIITEDSFQQIERAANTLVELIIYNVGKESIKSQIALVQKMHAHANAIREICKSWPMADYSDLSMRYKNIYEDVLFNEKSNEMVGVPSSIVKEVRGCNDKNCSQDHPFNGNRGRECSNL